MNNAKNLKKNHLLKPIIVKIETEKSQKKLKEKDTGSNHVVPVMLTFYDTDCKTVKERNSRSRVCIHSKEHENAISFCMHIITFLWIKEQAHSLGVPDFELKIFRL